MQISGSRILGSFGIVLAAATLLIAPAAAQDMSAFRTGPVFTDFGPHAPVSTSDKLPADTEFRVVFDVATPAKQGQRSRAIENAARFINMHAAAGVDPANIHIVVVVHGGAANDLLNDDAWAERELGVSNPSAGMIREMQEKGVRFILCGQTGMAHDIGHDDLISGVKTALSAMTAHALLQQRGYTLNPF